MNESKAACAFCCFWNRAGESVFVEDKQEVKVPFGECRAHPPAPACMLKKDDDCPWPLTLEQDWCGEFEPNAQVIEEVKRVDAEASLAAKALVGQFGKLLEMPREVKPGAGGEEPHA